MLVLKMMQRMRAILLITLALIACQSTPPKKTPASAGSRIEIVDDTGRVVRFEARPKRLLSLAPSHTEWIFALGASEHLVGRTDLCDAPQEALKIPSIGSLFPPDYERIVAARPDVALMLEGSKPIRERLTRLGIEVLVFQPHSLDGIYREGEALGRLLGVEAEARRVISKMKARLDACVPPQTHRPSVFYEVWPEPLSTAGADSFISALIEAAGGRNIIEAPGWPRYDLERLIVAEPDFIIAPNEGKLRRGPAWKHLKAIREGRLFIPPEPALFARPTPRSVEAICALAARLHP